MRAAEHGRRATLLLPMCDGHLAATGGVPCSRNRPASRVFRDSASISDGPLQGGRDARAGWLPGGLTRWRRTGGFTFSFWRLADWDRADRARHVLTRRPTSPLPQTIRPLGMHVAGSCNCQPYNTQVRRACDGRAPLSTTVARANRLRSVKLSAPPVGRLFPLMGFREGCEQIKSLNQCGALHPRNEGDGAK